ncbi:Rossmann-like and DUF2520 domain-containing protein [Burkholderia gladioli]|uniref:Rossmann-like and DUF2520 domain-containing protein n=1 Tax=Burkholderia gladioli TaxID=28095 RepID=UPI000CDA0CC5|nr:DUF2520 domain-containing protein [Burkholderia gladioli]MDN7801708.1 DUF2520 domain-containing protein [Burkholderia gladioli]POS06157.1 DUF2520 domain-containing protein [Burkholderia gladioli]
MSLPPVPRLGFIGAGRLGRCLARRFAQAAYPVVAVASRSPAPARALAAQIDGCTAVENAQAVVDAADLVFVAVSDDGIGPVAASLRFDPSRAPTQALVHCSGASSLDLLAPAAEQGVQTGGFHPLYLFGGGDADLARIEGCSVTIEAGGSLRPVLEALSGALGCHPLAIPAGGRMRYHAAANYAASFVLCGLAEAVELWRTLGMDEEEALRALLPMLSGTIETAREKGLSNALAGPVSRGDAGIVERQLDLLDQMGGDHATLYALMTRRAVELARRRATPPAGLDAVERGVDALLDRRLAQAAPGRREP